MKRKIQPKPDQAELLANAAKIREKMPTPQPAITLPPAGVPKLTSIEPLSISNLEPLRMASLLPSFEALFHSSETLEYPKQVGQVFSLFHNRHLLSRPVTKSLYDTIATTQSTIILEGRSGVGKSATMLQLACLFSQNPSFLLIYIPNAHSWTVGKYPYHPVTNQDGTISFDQPDISASVLRNILSLNASKFSSQSEQFQEEIKRSLKETSEGLSLATDTLTRILDGSLLAKLWPSSPTILCLVDQVNAFSVPLSYKTPRGDPIPAEQFPVINSVKNLLNSAHEKIKIIGALSYSDPQLRKVTSANISTNGTVVNVPALDRNEMHAILEYYRSLGYIYEKNLDGIYLERKLYHTGGNAHALFQACAYDNLY